MMTLKLRRPRAAMGDRAAQGLRLINLEEGDQVAAVCLVSSENGDEGSQQPKLIQ